MRSSYFKHSNLSSARHYNNCYIDKSTYRFSDFVNCKWTWVIGALILIVLFLFLGFSNFNWFDYSSEKGQYAGKTVEEIQKSLDLDVAEGEMCVSIAHQLRFLNGSENEGVANIENLAANKVDQKVKISLDSTGDVVYESGAIAPDYCINNIKLNCYLEPGEYDATALFTGYDTQTHKPKGSVAGKIKILVI